MTEYFDSIDFIMISKYTHIGNIKSQTYIYTQIIALTTLFDSYKNLPTDSRNIKIKQLI